MEFIDVRDLVEFALLDYTVPAANFFFFNQILEIGKANYDIRDADNDALQSEVSWNGVHKNT